MWNLLRIALVLVFLCHPPILFCLNGRCTKRFHPALVALSSFLLGWFLCILLGLVLTVGEFGADIVGLILLITVTSGGHVSGAILLLWAPIITIFVARSRKIKVLVGVLALAVVLLVSSVYIHERNSWRVPGNRLIHDGYNRAFLDGSYMRFAVPPSPTGGRRKVSSMVLKDMPGSTNRQNFIAACGMISMARGCTLKVVTGRIAPHGNDLKTGAWNNRFSGVRACILTLSPR